MNAWLTRPLSAAAEHRAAPYLLIALLTVLLYARSAGFQLLSTWDDAEYILQNRLVTQPLTLDSVKAIFTTTAMGNYAPLHILANTLQYRLWGAGPGGYHLVSTALHAVNACLLFLLLRRMTASVPIALWAALAFAVHPANVENVAWVSEQKTLFATCFGLLSLWWYLRARDEGRPPLFGLSAAAFLVGLLFKVSILPLPVILAAWEIAAGRIRTAWSALAPFVLIAGTAAGAAVWAQMQAGAVGQGMLDPAFLVGTVYPTMAPVLWHYPALVLFPVGLSAYYDAPLRSGFADPAVLTAIAAAVVVLGLTAWNGSPRVRFWTFWFCILLAPVANIVPLPVYYADRYLYLPAIGLFVLLGIGGEAASARAIVPRTAVLAAAVAAVVVLAGLAHARLDVWRSDLALWEDTVRRSPGLYKPHLNLGIAYGNAGRYAEAERELLRSLAIRPTDKARYHLELVRYKMGSAGK